MNQIVKLLGIASILLVVGCASNTSTSVRLESLTSEYEVNLVGFTSSDMQSIQDALAEMRGQKSLRLVYADNRRMEMVYATRASASSVLAALRNEAEELGVSARTRFSGNEIVLESVSSRPARPKRNDDGWEWQA